VEEPAKDIATSVLSLAVESAEVVLWLLAASDCPVVLLTAMTFCAGWCPGLNQAMSLSGRASR